MIEHWYEYLPAAWYTEGRWYVIISIVVLMVLAFLAGYLVGRRRKISIWLIQPHGGWRSSVRV